jgi:chloramphenicol O-acetyltransferase
MTQFAVLLIQLQQTWSDFVENFLEQIEQTKSRTFCRQSY